MDPRRSTESDTGRSAQCVCFKQHVGTDNQPRHGSVTARDTRTTRSVDRVGLDPPDHFNIASTGRCHTPVWCNTGRSSRGCDPDRRGKPHSRCRSNVGKSGRRTAKPGRRGSVISGLGASPGTSSVAWSAVRSGRAAAYRRPSPARSPTGRSARLATGTVYNTIPSAGHASSTGADGNGDCAIHGCSNRAANPGRRYSARQQGESTAWQHGHVGDLEPIAAQSPRHYRSRCSDSSSATHDSRPAVRRWYRLADPGGGGAVAAANRSTDRTNVAEQPAGWRTTDGCRCPIVRSSHAYG